MGLQFIFVCLFVCFFNMFAVLQSLYFQVYPTQGSIVLGGNQQFQFDYVLPFDCPQHVIYKFVSMKSI